MQLWVAKIHFCGKVVSKEVDRHCDSASQRLILLAACPTGKWLQMSVSWGNPMRYATLWFIRFKKLHTDGGWGGLLTNHFQVIAMDQYHLLFPMKNRYVLLRNTPNALFLMLILMFTYSVFGISSSSLARKPFGHHGLSLSIIYIQHASHYLRYLLEERKQEVTFSSHTRRWTPHEGYVSPRCAA